MQKIEEKTQERTILVGAGINYKTSVEDESGEILDELKLLAKTAGASVVGTLVQTRSTIDKTYYIGKGKAAELGELVAELEASSVIFDNDLTPAQVSNLQKLLDIKVIDRSGLILDIFAQRARTREAKTQVELAQLKYLLPRLTRIWTHLSRQEGGIGTRGPGETQLEVDRRRIRERISHLSRVLKTIEKRHSISRKKRGNCFKVSIVGYTNAGKSTLLNALSGADVPVEDKLFKTLDSVTRLIKLQTTADILLSDTVGFIRDLPHDLIASFRSTLDEVRDANLLLHVVDITNHDWEKQVNVVQDVLTDLGVAETETVKVFNKMDRCENKALPDALRFSFPDAVFVSAARKTGLDELREVIRSAVMKGYIIHTMVINDETSGMLPDIYRYGTVQKSEEEGDEVRLTFTLPIPIAKKLGF
ncbi:GTPase HflX [Candidatus Latescibacterota bacterium]